MDIRPIQIGDASVYRTHLEQYETIVCVVAEIARALFRVRRQQIAAHVRFNVISYLKM